MVQKTLSIWLFFLVCIGYSNAQHKQLDSLQNLIQTYSNLPLEKRKDSSYIDLINQYSLANYYVDKDSIYYYAKESLALSKSIGYTKGEIEALINIAFYESELGRQTNAIHLAEKALKKAEEIQSLYYLLICYSNIATFYEYSGDIQNSVEYSLRGIYLAENKEDKTQAEISYLSLIYENLGITYGIQKEYKKALEFLDKAQEINIKTNNTLAQAETMSNMASFQLKTKEYEKGLKNVNASIPIFEKYGYQDWLAYALKVKGQLYVEIKDYERALNIFMRSLDLYENIEDKREKTSLLNGIARTYMGIKEYDLAQHYADQALKNAQQLNSFEDLKACSKTLYLLYKKLGEYDKALTYHEEFKRYNDSIFNLENSKSIAANEAQLDFIAKENKLILENEKKLNRQRLWIYLYSFGGVVLLTILFFTQRSRKLERKLNSLLANKNFDLKKRERELQELNETKNKFFSIIAHDLRAPIASLNGLIDLLKDKQINAKDFMQFAPQLSEQVKNISFTLNNLLIWGQAQMKGAKSKPEPCDIGKLAQQNVQLLSEQAQKKHIVIQQRIAPKSIAYVDREQINLVFRNIINNAIKFTENNGKIYIQAKEIGNEYQIEISDNGVGMDPEFINDLTSDKTTFNTTYGTQNEKGTGLGLNLCKEMIVKNRGKLWIKSELGKGSTFYFTLPKDLEDWLWRLKLNIIKVCISHPKQNWEKSFIQE